MCRAGCTPSVEGKHVLEMWVAGAIHRPLSKAAHPPGGSYGRLGQRALARSPTTLGGCASAACSADHNSFEGLPTKHGRGPVAGDSSPQHLGSRRAANARNRAYASVHKSARKARRPA